MKPPPGEVYRGGTGKSVNRRAADLRTSYYCHVTAASAFFVVYSTSRSGWDRGGVGDCVRLFGLGETCRACGFSDITTATGCLEAVALTGAVLLNKFAGPARAQARPSKLAGIAWFGLLYTIGAY